MNDERSNALVFRRYCEEAWGRGNFDVLDELLTRDLVGHSGMRDRNRGQLEADMGSYRDAHRDMTFEILDLVDGRIAEEWTIWADFEPEA